MIEIEEVFNMESKEIVQANKVHSMVPKEESEFQQVVKYNQKEDYIRMRDNLHNVLSEAEIVITEVANAVKVDPSPRRVETFALLIKSYSDINQLLSPKDQTTQSPKEDSSVNNNTINTVVFTGTSDAMIEAVKMVSRGVIDVQ